MKIACICNINHAQYILARYLRDMGHDVTLFLMEEYPHFYPEFDSYGPVQGIKVVELPWKHKELYKTSKKEILSFLGGFDFYCGSEFAPAFLFKAGIQMDIYIPIGTDLVDYPFAKPKGLIPDTWAIDEYQFNLFQKGGIRTAGAIFMNRGGDQILEGALQKIGFRGKRYPTSLPYLYLPEYLSDKAVSVYETQIAALREKYGLMLISHGRCEFLQKDSLHYKGTDIMLKSLAEFIHAGHKDTLLVMTEYGNDWEAAKTLAEELGITDHIYWLPQCGRKEIFPLLRHFDAAFGVLSYPHWSYNVAMEAIAAGIPLIQKQGEKEIAGIYPFLGVREDGDLRKIFNKLAAEKDGIERIRDYGKSWYKERNHGVLADLKTLTNEAKQRKKPGFYFIEILSWMYNNTAIRVLSKLKFVVLFFTQNN